MNTLGRVLVTGAGGFIGYHLLTRLAGSGAPLRALVHSGQIVGRWPEWVETIASDVCDKNRVWPTMNGVDTVFHLAGKAHNLSELDSTAEHHQVTVEGTQNVLAAARKSGVKRFVFFSSLAVYPESCVGLRDESAPCRPRSAYGKAKLEAEALVTGTGADSGMHTVCLRPALVYGPGCKGNLAAMIAMIRRGMFPPLPRINAPRSVLHVDNLIDAAMLVATHEAARGQCYIVTDAEAYTPRELYEMICRALGRAVPSWAVPLAALKLAGCLGDVIGRLRGRRFAIDSRSVQKLTSPAWFSSAKIAADVGYQPSLTLRETLPALLSTF